MQTEFQITKWLYINKKSHYYAQPLSSTIVLILEEHLILCIYSRAALSLFYLYIIFAYSITLCVLFADDPQLHGTSGAH